MNFQDVVDAWDVAPLDAIHPTRAISEEAYEASGEVSAAAIAEVISKGLVVDFGCGDGRVAIPLRKLGFDVVGVDSSARMINELYQRDPDMVGIVSDGSDLTAELARDQDRPSKATTVLCLAVLIHHDYAGCRRILLDLRKVVKKGGLLILHWPTSEQPGERQAYTQVTTWSPDAQNALAADLRMKRVDLDLPWSCWRAV